MYESISRAFGLVLTEVEEAKKLPKPIDMRKVKLKTKPYKHQKEAVAFMLREFGFTVKGDK